MLWLIIAILVLLWLGGFIGGYQFGGLVHLLLVIALIVLIVKLVRRV